MVHRGSKEGNPNPVERCYTTVKDKRLIRVVCRQQDGCGSSFALCALLCGRQREPSEHACSMALSGTRSFSAGLYFCRGEEKRRGRSWEVGREGETQPTAMRRAAGKEMSLTGALRLFATGRVTPHPMTSSNPATPQKPDTIPSGVRLQHTHLWGGGGEDTQPTAESLLRSFMKQST